MADDILKDCSDECGCTMEIGTVINDNDCVFECELTGDRASVEDTFSRYAETAKNVCAGAVINFDDAESDGTLTRKVTIEFSCTAENIIFQLRVKSA